MTINYAKNLIPLDRELSSNNPVDDDSARKINDIVESVANRNKEIQQYNYYLTQKTIDGDFNNITVNGNEIIRGTLDVAGTSLLESDVTAKGNITVVKTLPVLTLQDQNGYQAVLAKSSVSNETKLTGDINALIDYTVQFNPTLTNGLMYVNDNAKLNVTPVNDFLLTFKFQIPATTTDGTMVAKTYSSYQAGWSVYLAAGQLCIGHQVGSIPYIGASCPFIWGDNKMHTLQLREINVSYSTGGGGSVIYTKLECFVDGLSACSVTTNGNTGYNTNNQQLKVGYGGLKGVISAVSMTQEVGATWWVNLIGQGPCKISGVWTPMFSYALNEGTGTNIIDTVNGLNGTLQGDYVWNVPVTLKQTVKVIDVVDGTVLNKGGSVSVGDLSGLPNNLLLNGVVTKIGEDIPETGNALEWDGTKWTPTPLLHDLDDRSYHKSSLTSGKMVKSDTNGLPADASNTDTEVASTVSLKHTQGSDVALGSIPPKNPPLDADIVPYKDSANNWLLATSTWTQIKAFLKTYFDTTYKAIFNYTAEDVANKSTNDSLGAYILDQSQLLYADFYDLRTTTGATAFGQGFISPVTKPLSKVTVKLKKTGTPTGNVWIELYLAEVGGLTPGVPTGGVLATSNTLNATMVSGSATDYEFTFASEYTLTATTQYCIVLQGDYTITGSDYVTTYGKDTTNPYANGIFSVYSSATAQWYPSAYADMYFMTYYSDVNDTKYPSQKAVKTYVDAKGSGGGLLHGNESAIPALTAGQTYWCDDTGVMFYGS